MKFENCTSRTAILLKIVLSKKLVSSVKTDKDKKMDGKNTQETALAQTLLPLLRKEPATLQSPGVTSNPS